MAESRFCRLITSTSSQAQLLDSFYGIDRGLQASTEVRAEISELITRLEARNPTAAPNEVSVGIFIEERMTCSLASKLELSASRAPTSQKAICPSSCLLKVSNC